MSAPNPRSFVSRLGRFTTLNVGQQALLMALALVTTPVLYHRLGDTAYGILAIVTLLSSQLAILEFGFGHATIRWVSQCRARGDEDGLRRTLAASSWVFAGTAALGGGVLLVGAAPLVERFFNVPAEARETAILAVRIGSLFFIASVFGNLASAVWQGLQRFGVLNVISGVAAALQMLGSLALVLAGHGVAAVVAWSAALGFLALGVNLAGLRRALGAGRLSGRLDAGTLREMGRFGLLLMLAGAFTQVVISGGPLVLGHFVVIGALPFFTVPLGLYQRLNRMAYGLAGALFPLVSELHGQRDDRTLDRVFVSGTRALLRAGVASMAPAALLASPFLSLWMGPEFAAEAGRPLELLFAAFALALATIPSIELARGTGRAGLLVAYTGIQAVVTVAGVALLAGGWGTSGAAMAFLAAQAAGLVFLAARVGGASCGRVLDLGTVLVVVAGTGSALGAMAVVESGLARLGLAAALGVALAAAALGTMDGEERDALRRMVTRP